MDGNYGYERQNKDRSTVKVILTVVIAIVIAVSCFFIGFFSRSCFGSYGSASYNWVLSTIEDNYYYYDEFDGGEAKNLSLKAIASKLDKYSEYYTAEEYAAQIADNGGQKSGIGISYNYVYIVSVVGNSPANAAGIRPGDVIVSGTADGKVTAFDTSDAFAEFATARETGEEFVLSTEDSDFTLAKEVYIASYAYMATAQTAWEFVSSGDGSGLALVENRDKAISYLPDGAAYVYLYQFFGTMADEFGTLMKKFNAENCTSMYIDLRNNGGGYVTAMQDLAGYFTSSISDKTQVAMTAKYKSGKQEIYNCYKHNGDSLVPKDTDIYVLANSGTASASEAFIGVLVSYNLLEYKNIFISDYSEEYLDWAGEGVKTAQTYGKGIMQTTFVNRPTGEALKLTTAQIYWPNDKCIHEVALSEKDGCTLVKADWTATKGDTELQRVVEMTK